MYRATCSLHIMQVRVDLSNEELATNRCVVRVAAVVRGRELGVTAPWWPRALRRVAVVVTGARGTTPAIKRLLVVILVLVTATIAATASRHSQSERSTGRDGCVPQQTSGNTRTKKPPYRRCMHMLEHETLSDGSVIKLKFIPSPVQFQPDDWPGG